jgi:hypothetical protein
VPSFTTSAPPVVNTAPSITSSYSVTSALTTDNIAIPYTITDAQGGSLVATYTKDGVPGTATVAVGSNTWSVGTLTAGNHTLTIQVKDDGNLTSNTLTFSISVSVPVDVTPPQPVGSLTAGTATENSIPVTWTLSPSNDVANYEVAYSSNSGVSYTVASNVINSSSTSYNIIGLASNTDYIVRVVAIDTSGNRSTPVTVTKRTAVSTVPGNGIIDGGTFVNNTVTSTVDGGAFTDTVFSATRDGGTFVTAGATNVDGGAFGDTTTGNIDGGTFGDTDTGSIDGGTF